MHFRTTAGISGGKIGIKEEVRTAHIGSGQAVRTAHLRGEVGAAVVVARCAGVGAGAGAGASGR